MPDAQRILERRTGERATASELSEMLANYCAENGLPAQRPMTDDDLARVRSKRAELFAQWEAVEPGEALEIGYPESNSRPSP